MFNLFKKQPATDVTGILEEGRSWVKRLEIAATDTEKEANLIDKDVLMLQKEAESTHAEAAEGKAVAANFKKMLLIKK